MLMTQNYVNDTHKISEMVLFDIGMPNPTLTNLEIQGGIGEDSLP